MTMAYKYQLQLCNGPEHLVLITLNHLDCVRRILPEDGTLNQLLDAAHQMVTISTFLTVEETTFTKIHPIIPENFEFPPKISNFLDNSQKNK